MTKKYSKEEEEDYLDALEEQPNIILPEIKVLQLPRFNARKQFDNSINSEILAEDQYEYIGR